MLSHVANKYESDVDIAVESLKSLIHPVLIVGLGLVVGFIVIALFMPLVKLLNELS